MKYKILLLLIALLCNLFPNRLVYAHDCPPGYTLAWTFFTFNHPSVPFDCIYWVEYCYRCDEQNKKVYVDDYWYYGWEGGRYRIWEDMIESFKYQARRQAAIDAITRCFPNLPSCDPPPPPNYTVEMRQSRCMYYENFWFNKFTGSEEWLWVLRPCGNLINACSYTYQLCIDYSLPIPQVKILYENCISYEPPGCSEQYPELPPQGKTWEEPWRTECFARPCCPQ